MKFYVIWKYSEVILVDECKVLSKEAKDLEKEDKIGAINKYKEAAACFKQYDKSKDYSNTLEKAAKLYRDLAKLTKNPEDAFNYYSESAQLYVQADNSSEGEKMKKEGYRNYINNAKEIHSMGNKSDSLDEVINLLVKASDLASKGQDEELHNTCWIDLGNRYCKEAESQNNPREALDYYKAGIKCFRLASSEVFENKTWTKAGDKFEQSASIIEKSGKEYSKAVDFHVQAVTLYELAQNDEKMISVNNIIDDLCIQIGLPLNYISDFWHNQGLGPISTEIE